MNGETKSKILLILLVGIIAIACGTIVSAFVHIDLPQENVLDDLEEIENETLLSINDSIKNPNNTTTTTTQKTKKSSSSKNYKKSSTSSSNYSSSNSGNSNSGSTTSSQNTGSNSESRNDYSNQNQHTPTTTQSASSQYEEHTTG